MIRFKPLLIQTSIVNINLSCLLIALFYLGFSSYAQSKLVLNDSVMKLRARVIIDNDFGGDPDGLFQLAHHLLSPTVDIKGIIGSIQYPNGFYGYPGNVEFSTQRANNLISKMGLEVQFKVIPGSNSPLADTVSPSPSPASKLIIDEALNESNLPLFVVCGAGLTNVASAFLEEPEIAGKFTLIWIGGTECKGIASPPPGAGMHWEYNSGIHINACKVVFNQSQIPIWQLPRDAYRQALASYAELKLNVGMADDHGDYLIDQLDDLFKRADRTKGEAYMVGDNPLVLLTALQSSWEVDPSSSKYSIVKAPKVAEDNLFLSSDTGRKIRVYHDLDIRLMLEDFYAKLALFEMEKTLNEE